jgi:hypothetical protein
VSLKSLPLVVLESRSFSHFHSTRYSTDKLQTTAAMEHRVLPLLLVVGCAFAVSMTLKSGESVQFLVVEFSELFPLPFTTLFLFCIVRRP